jgi:hypothetical protein
LRGAASFFQGTKCLVLDHFKGDTFFYDCLFA